MTLIIGIVLTAVFYIVSANAIKKHPGVFYIGIYVWCGMVVFYFNMGYDKNFPEWFNEYFMNIFARGIFSTATFMVVMFLGTITKHSKLSRKLMSVRGEISIIGSLIVLSHNVVFGVTYFPMLFTNPKAMPTRQMIASIITLCLLAMLIPLFLTSFKFVRRKMKGKTWKNVQRLAYPFFIGIYVHVMVLYSADVKAHLSGIIIYTLIYGSYIVLRLRKAALKARKSRITTEQAV